MNIELLELFVLLSKHQSFSKVAELTYSSQSSVSKKIAKLESLADIRLFNRDPNGVLLTEAGQLVLPYAEEIIRLHNEALMQLDKFQTRSANQLKLGATLGKPCASACWLASAIPRPILTTLPGITSSKPIRRICAEAPGSIPYSLVSSK